MAPQCLPLFLEGYLLYHCHSALGLFFSDCLLRILPERLAPVLMLLGAALTQPLMELVDKIPAPGPSVQTALKRILYSFPECPQQD